MKRSRIVVPDAEVLSVEISGTDVLSTDVSGTDVSDPEDAGRGIVDKELCGSASSVRSKICPCREYSRASRQTLTR